MDQYEFHDALILGVKRVADTLIFDLEGVCEHPAARYTLMTMTLQGVTAITAVNHLAAGSQQADVVEPIGQWAEIHDLTYREGRMSAFVTWIHADLPGQTQAEYTIACAALETTVTAYING